MKKHLVLFCCMISFGLSAIANDPPKGTYRCKLPGSYDYVTIDYFNEGKGCGYLVFSNQSNMLITRMHVKVEVTESWIETKEIPPRYTGDEPTYEEIPHSHTTVLCDDTFYDIPCNRSEKRSNSSRGPVKGGNERSTHSYTYKVTVVDDPICKPLE